MPFSPLSILIKFYVNVSGSNLYISFFYLYIKNLKITKNGNEIISLVKEEINNIILMSVKNIIKNKAVSLDLIPDKSLKNEIKPYYYGKVEDILNKTSLFFV